jgi:hypothetical protein
MRKHQTMVVAIITAALNFAYRHWQLTSLCKGGGCENSNAHRV